MGDRDLVARMLGFAMPVATRVGMLTEGEDSHG
jgi:hypothetical protein